MFIAERTHIVLLVFALVSRDQMVLFMAANMVTGFIQLSLMNRIAIFSNRFGQSRNLIHCGHSWILKS